MSWGKDLSRIISAAEARVSWYGKALGAAYRSGDDEMKVLLREIKNDELANLKRLRAEKTAWNSGMWMAL